jgi:hypothetical protein
MKEFEKNGYLYLGKFVNASTKALENEPLLYDSKNLTTHAVCVGMTGSGKTGLGITIIEEAALDKIPSLIIDPKGDLTNLLLTFPDLSEEEFLPWVDKAEAERKEMSAEEYAKSIAKTWKEGLEAWNEKPERIQKLRNNVEMTIYTPASQAGVPLSILSSFAAPSKELLLDKDAIRGRILSTASSILGLLGIEANPIKSREHILISSILSQAWYNEKDLNIETLIEQVQKPPFDKIGTLDVDTFFPPKERKALSVNLNNLLASPGFHAWMEGEPLDIQKLLYTNEGKPKLAILYIAHLSDSERMFFVTLLLNEFLSWMRQQPGTSSLRALLYMDEIFGFFPPTAMPPSKTPMLTLLKQARAYGIGIVLATQNPVDLDYKGLSNCGTWFIGKLQTERDKARVIEGLNAASNGEIDAKTLDKMIGSIGKRIFLMRSIYEKEPILFQTRWTLSYLRGPLTLAQIDTLTDKSSFPSSWSNNLKQENESVSKTKPNAPLGIEEFFIKGDPKEQSVHYKPYLLGIAKLHFVDSKSKIDQWINICKLAQVDNGGKTALWESGKVLSDYETILYPNALPESTYEKLPLSLSQEKNYVEFKKGFAEYLYQNQTLTQFKAIDVGLISKEDELESDFRERAIKAKQIQNEETIKKVKEKYAAKIAALTEKVRRGQEKLNQKQQKVGMTRWETWISFGAMVLGAIFGRKITKGTITGAGTSLKRVGKVTKDSQDVQTAEEELLKYQEDLKDLHAQLEDECVRIQASSNDVTIEKIVLRPRKSDIDIEKIALAWNPLG